MVAWNLLNLAAAGAIFAILFLSLVSKHSSFLHATRSSVLSLAFVGIMHLQCIQLKEQTIDFFYIFKLEYFTMPVTYLFFLDSTPVSRVQQELAQQKS